MPLKIRNPFYLSPDMATAQAHGAAVRQFMEGRTGDKLVTLAELRAGLPAIAAQLTRPVVNQICADNGWQIDNPEDGQA